MKKKLYLLLHVFLFIFISEITLVKVFGEQITGNMPQIKEQNYTEKEYNRIYKNREHIKNMIVNLMINKDGSLTVNEEIEYYFASGVKHGIFRDIPVSYPGGSKKDIRIKINYIKRNGKNEPYKVRHDLKVLNLKIGNPKVYVTGMNKYILNYTVYNAVNKTGKNRYELDWNAIGQYWSYDILESEINIFFEGNQKIFSKDTNLEIYTGTFGTRGKDFYYIMEPDIIKITTSKILKTNKGLTVFLNFASDEIKPDILNWFKGFIYKNELLSYSIIFLLSFLVFMVLRLLTLKKNIEINKNAYGKVPDKLSAMFAFYLNKRKNINDIVSAGILTLISKKHMKMHPEIDDDAFELLNSDESLLKEERMLKTVLGKQKWEQSDIENIVENKINEILKKEKTAFDSKEIEEIKQTLSENTGQSGIISRFSKIYEVEFYKFQKEIDILLGEKKIKMIVKDKFSLVFTVILIGLIVFSEYKVCFMLTKSHAGGIAMGINFSIWTIVGLAVFIQGNPTKRLYIWGVVIGILLFIATRNIFILPVWFGFGYIYNKYANLKRRDTKYGAEINYEMDTIKNAVDNYESEIKHILSTDEMNKYIDRMSPYIIALKGKAGMEKIMESIKQNSFINYDEINNNFKNYYRYPGIRKQISKVHSRAVRSYSKSSGGGSRSSSSRSSGGGHGGGGGGSW
jgi:uncharacterized membrane protein YgcG